MKTIHYPLTAKQLNNSFDLSARIQIIDQTGQVFLSSEPELEANQIEERLEFCQHLVKLANESHEWNEGFTVNAKSNDNELELHKILKKEDQTKIFNLGRENTLLRQIIVAARPIVESVFNSAGNHSLDSYKSSTVVPISERYKGILELLMDMNYIHGNELHRQNENISPRPQDLPFVDNGAIKTDSKFKDLGNFKDILVEIENERLRQLGKWIDEPTHNGLNHLIICLNKHLGLAAFSLLGSSYKETQRRVVQVAALCVALYQTINRLLELKGKG